MRELSQHILDLLENAQEAGASRIWLEIEERSSGDARVDGLLSISVRDDGRGMDDDSLRRVTDPFYTTRTTRSVGLGIPLLKAAAERCGGQFGVGSVPGQGTQVTASFGLHHIGRAPMGDLISTLLAVVLGLPRGGLDKAPDLIYRHRVDGRFFELDTREIRSILGDLQLGHPQVLIWLRDYLEQGIASLYSRSGDQ